MEKRKYGYLVLVGILIILMFIIFGSYGFSNFLTGIEDKEVAALLLIIIIVGIILVMLQRAGIIFADKEYYQWNFVHTCYLPNSNMMIIEWIAFSWTDASCVVVQADE